MNHGPAWHDLEQLAAESDWARALARRLIADQNAADDVSQEALLATLGSPVRSTAWLGGVVRNLAASWRRPMILATTAALITIVVHADGFFAQSLGPVDGTRVVVLSEGLPVPFEWGNAAPPGAPFFVRITLTPTEEPAAMPGGKRAASLVRRFSPSQADFATGRSVTLRVPAPGAYQVRCEAGVLESSYQDIKSLAEARVIAVDATPRTQRVAVDARCLSAAWDELRAFQEKHKR